MLNLVRLNLLHRLSVLGTISAVADGVHLTRTAVSKQLTVLQDELQTILIERSGRGIRLTPAGRALATRAAELFEMVERIEAEVAAAKLEVRGDIRVASFNSFASSVVPVAIAHLLKDHPQLDVVVTEFEPTDGLRAIAAKQVDVVIVDDWVDAQAVANTLEFHPLYVDRFDLILSSAHKLASRKLIHFADLAGERFALSQAKHTHLYRGFVVNACYAAGFIPKVSASGSMPLTFEMVRSAGVVAILPRLALHAVQDDPDFTILPIEPVINRRIFAVIAKGGSKRPALAAMLQALVDAAEEFQRR